MPLTKLTKATTPQVKHHDENLETYLDNQVQQINLYLPDERKTSSYPSVQAATDAVTGTDTVELPAGVITANIQGGPSYKGRGNVTEWRPSGDFGTCVELPIHIPAWYYKDISGIYFNGEGTTGAKGISYDNDPLAGRYSFNNLFLRNLDTGFNKPAGNIGNSWNHSSFEKLNWGTRSLGNSIQHTGCDYYQHCVWSEINVYALYYNGLNQNGGFGNVVVRDGVMQMSQGGGIYLKDKVSDCPHAPLWVSNIWFEAMAQADAVQVDGVAVKPRQMHLINTEAAYAEGCYLNNIQLQNSHLHCYGTRHDNADGHQDFVVDDASTFTADRIYLNGSSGPDLIVSSILSQTLKFAGTDLSIRGEMPRNRFYTPMQGNKLKALTFNGGAHSWSGSGSAVPTLVPNGLLSPNCSQYTLPANSLLEMPDSKVTVTAGLWYVWGVSARVLSGSTTMEMSSGVRFGSVFTKTGRWVATFGVGQATTTGVVGLYATTPAGGCSLQLADYFVAEFATESQALEFANLRVALEE